MTVCVVNSYVYGHVLYKLPLTILVPSCALNTQRLCGQHSDATRFVSQDRRFFLFGGVAGNAVWPGRLHGVHSEMSNIIP